MQEILNFSNEKNMAETFRFNIGICVGAKLLAILHHHFLLSTIISERRGVSFA